MEFTRSDIVKSSAGRDKGKCFFVMNVDSDFLLLADGKSRKVEQPKRKKAKHVLFLAKGTGRTAEKIRSEEIITNSELRRTLAVYGEDGNPDQEG